MSLVKVTKFQAADGSLHDTAKAAELQNGKTRLAPVLEAYLSAKVSTGLDSAAGQLLQGFIIENAGDLRELLNEQLPERRASPKKNAEAANTAGQAAA